MRIDIITLFPGMMESPFGHSIVKRALNAQLVEIHYHDLRQYALPPRKQVDDYPFGGGVGLVIKIEPIFKCITDLKRKRGYDDIIYFAPDGELLNQKMANYYSTKKNLLLLCGHYKGVDQRIRDHLITKEISVGDYVLSGGEIAATVFCDAIVRLIPGVLSDLSSALGDSFQDDLIEAPIYTRPRIFNNWKVPEVLLSGNQSKIDQWRDQMSLTNTKNKRPHLYEKSYVNDSQTSKDTSE
ncbi:MAG: tRNA (guanosine(37)-N1)-methyltransferase TrmD [Flavobacteriaceae bacterium]|nr:tRNA (guanosine(37)-N1)-methyltransferase TrmD [Flavobacteriaceae bacterium]MCY4268388.1 tRNA (guanosine(37)-N1)-methyltransferase TrmD [Flavobacteriaceae bacterium]MCY4298375.1 tRNA (guanosine(37)-N1)-methyltransferase TrmD [Flavobacteriaceae bacterium]